MNSNSELYDCTSEITYWLLTNDLLVNTSKTELLNISKILVTFPTLSIDGIIRAGLSKLWAPGKKNVWAPLEFHNILNEPF